MEKVQIRRVERRDLEACAQLEHQCYSPLEAAPRNHLERRIEIYPDGFYVAKSGGRIVGMINSGATHKDDITDERLKHLVGHVRNGRNCVIFSLAVHPDFRRANIARMLVTKLIEVAEYKEKQRVLLLCRENLLDFYRRLGFGYGGLSRSTFGGFNWHQMHYDLLPPASLVANPRQVQGSLNAVRRTGFACKSGSSQFSRAAIGFQP